MSRVKREGEGRVSRVKKRAYSQVKRELVSREGEGRVIGVKEALIVG